MILCENYVLKGVMTSLTVISLQIEFKGLRLGTGPGYIPKGVITSLTLFALQIEFKGVKMRYRPGLPLVLKGLDVCIEAGTTCGVVGRTGINPLFTLLHASLAGLLTHNILRVASP